MSKNSQVHELSDSDLSSTLLGSTQDPTYHPSNPVNTEGENGFMNLTVYNFDLTADEDDLDSTGSFFFSQRRDLDSTTGSQKEVEANFDLGDSPPYVVDEEDIIPPEAVEDFDFNESFTGGEEYIGLMKGKAANSVEDEKGSASTNQAEEEEEETQLAVGPAKGVKKERKLKRENIHIEPDEHVRQKIPATTKKSTLYAVNLFNSTILQLSKELNFLYEDLKDTSIINLPWRLAKFFMVVTKEDGAPLNASSLETIYASLARFLSTEFVPRIDIKSDVNFKTVRENLDAAKQESTKDGHRPGKNKPRPFQDEHIALCWSKNTLGRHNPRSLVTTIHLQLLSNLGFRANLEVYNIKNEDVIMGPLGEGGVPEWIELSERVTKTRRGKIHNIRELDPKVFPDHENPETCPVRTFLEFNRRKTPLQNRGDQPFLLGVKQSAEKCPKKENFWYVNTRMGTHAIAKLLPRAFEAVGIDVKLEHYTATSARKTMLEGGVEAGVPSVLLSKVAGQAALGSIQHYVDGQQKSHKAMSLCLSRKVGANPGAEYKMLYKKAAEEELEKRAILKRDRTGEDDSEEEQLTISQSTRVVIEKTIEEHTISQSAKKARIANLPQQPGSTSKVPPTHNISTVKQSSSQQVFQSSSRDVQQMKQLLPGQMQYPPIHQNYRDVLQQSLPGQPQFHPVQRQDYQGQQHFLSTQQQTVGVTANQFLPGQHRFLVQQQFQSGQQQQFQPGQQHQFPLGQQQQFQADQHQQFQSEQQFHPGQQQQFHSGQQQQFHPGQQQQFHPGQQQQFHPGQQQQFHPGPQQQFHPGPQQQFHPGPQQQFLPNQQQYQFLPSQRSHQQYPPNQAFYGQSQSPLPQHFQPRQQFPPVHQFQRHQQLQQPSLSAQSSSGQQQLLYLQHQAQLQQDTSQDKLKLPSNGEQALLIQTNNRFSAQEGHSEEIKTLKGTLHQADPVTVSNQSVSSIDAENNDENPSDGTSIVFAKYLSFPYWPAKIISYEGSGVNVQFVDGSTSGTGGGVKMDKILPFSEESAKTIIKTTKFKSGKNSLREFKKACAMFDLEIQK